MPPSEHGRGKRRSLLPVAAALLLAACAADPVTIEVRDGVTYVDNPAVGLWQDREPLPLRFTLEQVYGAEEGPEEAVIGRVGGLTVDTGGNLYVLDAAMARLVSFGPEGEVRWTAGREGEGPGEFKDVRGMAFDGAGTLYVANRMGSQIDLWELDGTHRGTWSLASHGLSFVSPAGFAAPGTLVLTTFVSGTIGSRVTLWQTEEPPGTGEPAGLGGPPGPVAEFQVSVAPDTELPERLAGMVDVRAHGEGIFVGNAGRYVLRVYGPDGRLTRVVSRPAGHLVRPGFYAAERGAMMTDFGGLDAPLLLSTGHWLVYAHWPTNVADPDATVRRWMAGERPTIRWACSLDLFDPEGRFLLTRVWEDTRVPEIGEPELVGPGGRLYTVAEEPYPQIRRYRVEVR